jgi:hypothetical protein
VPVLAGIGALYAAWQSRHPLADPPWDQVDIDRLGGTS